MNRNSYQTRRLLAVRDMRHDGQSAVAGGEVFATEIDARYLIRSGLALDPGATPATSAPAAPNPPIAPPSPRRGPGRPPKTEIVARRPSSGLMTADGTGALVGSSQDGGDGEQKPDGGASESEGTGGGSEFGDQTAG